MRCENADDDESGDRKEKHALQQWRRYQVFSDVSLPFNIGSSSSRGKAHHTHSLPHRLLSALLHPHAVRCLALASRVASVSSLPSSIAVSALAAGGSGAARAFALPLLLPSPAQGARWDSTKRKRMRAMNRHKYQKLKKRMRHRGAQNIKQA